MLTLKIDNYSDSVFTVKSVNVTPGPQLKASDTRGVTTLTNQSITQLKLFTYNHIGLRGVCIASMADMSGAAVV